MNRTKLLIGGALLSTLLNIALVANAAFIEDSKLSIAMRNFYYDTDNREGGADQREWAQSFKLDYISGFTDGKLGFGVDVQNLVGVHLDGGKGHHPDSNSFTPSDSDGSATSEWSSIGATAKARFSKTEFRYGNTLMPNVPVVIANDGRLQPQTYEGGMFTSKEIDDITITGGQLGHAKGRASTNSTGLSVAGATEESNQFRFAGGDWKASKNLTLQYYYANLEDFYTQHFLGLVHVQPIGDNQSFKTDLRYFKSISDGANGEAGYRFNNNGGYAKNVGEVDNTTMIAMFTYTLHSHALMLGQQRVSDDGGLVWLSQANVVNGNGRNEGAGGISFYSFTDAMIGQFSRAGENTTFGQYTYDFANLGISGLKVSMAYLRGEDIKSVNGSAPDVHEWESDLRLDYVVPNGLLKGFGTTIRHGIYRGGGTSVADQDQTRLIFNYTYSFF
ncbi:OprD family outer membrane porin [Pseudomonas frederiksbergensis]|uniref:OprD family outer membrane porin n=1 Tax=Pseudomonas frederiksbergensis TaxID=104087 RepID=UPI003D23EF31